MKMQVTDEGRWFDLDAALQYRSGDQYLYRTALGTWVLSGPSRVATSGTFWVIVPNSKAAAWLIRNGLEITECLSEEVKKLEV